MKDNGYISIMIDGATDSSVKENEAIICRCIQDGKPVNKLLGLLTLEHCDANGVLDAIKKAFSDESIDYPDFLQRLVGFCSDGASVNFGKDNGVKTKLTRCCPWLVSIWCLPHRLELTVMAMLKDCREADQVIEVLHWIYKTYHYSPKSRRELKTLATELGVNIRNPARVKGTRWTPHLQKALYILLHNDRNNTELGQFGVVLQHSEHLASTSKNAEIRGRSLNVAKRMKTFSFLAMAHFLLDLFGIISSLSEKLQSNKTILPTAISALQSAITRLDNLVVRPVPQGFLHQLLSSVAANQEDNFKFQDAVISNVPADVEAEPSRMIASLPNTLKEAIKSAVTKTTKGMKNRMSAFLSDPSDTELQGEARAVASFRIFNHDSWPEGDNDLVDFGDEEVNILLDWFKEPLSRNECNLENVLGQWGSLKTLVVREFQDKSYSGLWSTFLMKQPYKSDYKDLLHLVQILLVMPISSAQCERVFSAQNRIKSDVRSSLHTQTLEDLIRISADGPALEDFEPESSAIKWTASANRPRKLQYTDWPDVLIPEDESDDN